MDKVARLWPVIKVLMLTPSVYWSWTAEDMAGSGHYAEATYRLFLAYVFYDVVWRNATKSVQPRQDQKPPQMPLVSARRDGGSSVYNRATGRYEEV